jgi:orotate phosphoribosyltransferase
MWQEDKDRLGREIIIKLYNLGMIKTWYRDNPQGWTLISGIWSPFYIQLRALSSYPILLNTVGRAMGRMTQEECGCLDRILGVAMAGIPIALAISLSINIPACFTRKLEGIRSINNLSDVINKYGEHSLIEGEINENDQIGIVDDLVTKFSSKSIAIKQLENEVKLRKLNNINCSDVLVLIDREQGAEENAREQAVNLHSLIPFTSKGIEWLRWTISEREYEIIKDYLKNSDYYQSKRVQVELLKDI